MDFVKNLLGDTACNVDGTFTSRNPVSAVVDRIFDSAMSVGTGSMMSDNDRGSMMAGSGVMYSEPEQLQYGPGRYDLSHMDSVWNSLQGEGESAGMMHPEMAYNPEMQQMMGMQHMMTMMQQQNHMLMMMQQQQQQQQHEAEQQAFHDQQMEQAGMHEKQYDDMDSNEYMQQHGDVQGVDAAILDAMQGGDLSAERLDDIWDQFQQQQPQPQQELNQGANKTGLDMAWASIQEKIETQGAAKADIYDFAAQNQYLANHQAAALAAQTVQSASSDDLFEEGMRLFREGSIKQAVLAFEADVQAQADRDESWRMLGMCHAENDMDKAAITCLRRALECDPYNLEALLALGTSYVNELDSAGALAVLKEWVLHHPEFCGLTPPEDEYSDGTLMDEVMQLILAVHEYAPHDVDVKVLLGVLYNVSQNFGEAAQLFRQALEARPEDYTLYNKLGATLANSNGSSDAIPVYKQALRIRPSYARGWLNLGISHANLNEYTEAARAYVTALHKNPTGKHIWGYLRVVFTCMDDLKAVELCGRENLQAVAESLSMELAHTDV